MNFDPESLAVLIPIVALIIPIVAILTKHQHKMAELIHGRQEESSNLNPLLHEIRLLRSEVEMLKEGQNVQRIEMDDLRGLRQVASIQESNDQSNVSTGA